MKSVAVAFAIAVATAILFVGAFNIAAAQTPDAGPGSGSDVTPAPSDSIDNPLTNPGEAYDDLKAAKRLGWGVLALAVGVMLARVLGMLGGWFSFLRRGKVALAIAAGGTFAVTAYNAIMLGGTWIAAAAAAIVAAAAAWDAAAKPKDPA